MEVGDLQLGAAAIALLAEQARGDAAALAAVADLARRSRLSEEAYRLAVEAREAAPHDPAITAATARAFADSVPDWHFSIVRDQPRNDAWEAALRKAVTAESLVLDIGAGTGLLAMMAARAGAREVISCEMNPALADVARAIVELNGLSDRVRVISTHSSKLDLDSLCGRRADVVVSEILANDLVGEGATEVMTDVLDRLLAPGGRIIPVSGDVQVALAHWANASKPALGSISGFDLSPLELVRRRPRHVKVGDPALTLQSAAGTLFSVGFAEKQPGADIRSSCALRLAEGPANGVIQWIRVRLDEEIAHENAPSPESKSSWDALFHPFPEGMAPKAGDPVLVHAIRRSGHLEIWSEV